MAEKRVTKTNNDDILSSIREACEADLYTFAQTMFPDRYYGDIHKEFFYFLQHDPSRNKLGLIPRDHQKSHCIAVLCCWLITKSPWITINYVSANADLVSAQMNTIKHVLRSEQYRLLWPQMLNYVKDREGYQYKPFGKWQEMLIEVDHPERKARAVRDPTVKMSTVKSTNTGMHAEVTVFDDLVTDENYESEAERRDVIKCYKNFAKISTTGSRMYAVGTRYGPNDLYALMIDQEVEYVDDNGFDTTEKRWAVFEKCVEDSPYRDGSGIYIWPRTQMPNGEWFGFDQKELAIKRSDLRIDGDMSSFYAQYYNDPNAEALRKFSTDDFMYWDQHSLKQDRGQWYYKGKLLKLTVSADLAFTEKSVGLKAKRRDSTAIIVLGRDGDGFFYVLDMVRFQTDDVNVYYQKIIELHQFWGFSKIVIETNNGGKVVKKFIEDQVRREGSLLIVDGKAQPTRQSKTERIEQVLFPLYRQKSILHPKSGLTKQLESEIILPKPAHDDLKDALALAISESRAPMGSGIRNTSNNTPQQVFNRFGARRRGR